MDFFELIKNRESIRSYDPDRPLPEAILTRILEAGRLAPSACNNQPYRFLVVSSAEILEKVRPCYGRSWFQDAPHILIVVGKLDEAWSSAVTRESSLETDVTIALDHMILAAENEGVATCWVLAYDPIILKKALSIEDNERIFAITPLGYPRDGFVKKHNKQRKPLSEIVEML